PYTQAILANKFIILTGQNPLHPSTGHLVQGDIQAQARQCLENLKAILEASGSSMDKLVKVTVFAKDLQHFQAINQVYSEYFKENPPARSFVEVSRLPRDAAIEIEGIALLDNQESIKSRS
ncbi:MAG: Rid family detoxifying hydrolase, partial [Candidatus Bipolaricaulota bacterium]|nr:Rid family detoxifying hydrolase [Candidatus Bipolaricaulota bacterium]